MRKEEGTGDKAGCASGVQDGLRHGVSGGVEQWEEGCVGTKGFRLGI